MRTELRSAKGLTVKAIAGTHVILLAFDCTKAYCKGVLGFGIERTDHENGENIWLRGLRRFDLPISDDGADVSTRHHPIQKFHWGDYTAKPGRRYTYTVHTFIGPASQLVEIDRVAVTVTAEHPDRVGPNGHQIHFNRSAAASQAFSRRFPNLPKGDVDDPSARTWLSRGLAEALVRFIDETPAGHGLHLFLYELSKEDFFQALVRAKTRGVTLEILYDAITKSGKAGKKEKVPSDDSVPLLKKHKLTAVAKGRTGAGINISHNKFMVRTDAQRRPTAVWTGSTNWTDNGIYGQSNVGHVVTDPRLAKQYFDWHRQIWAEPDTSAALSRQAAMQLTALPAPQATTLVLSPRKTIEAITACARLVTGPHRLVCFTAPFAMHDDLEDALATADAQVLGLLNNHSVVGAGLKAAKNTQLAWAAALDEPSLLEAWQGHLQKESMHHSGVFIHTKILLIDPLGPAPVVVTGSANFSDNSSTKNDENQLFIADEPAVADVYLGEFMRMFDHYYFRSYVKALPAKRKKDPKAGFLDATDGWTTPFFDGGEREALRRAFF